MWKQAFIYVPMHSEIYGLLSMYFNILTFLLMI